VIKPRRVRARQGVGDLLFLAGRRHPRPASLTVLMYHAITRTPLDDDYQMTVSASQFDEQMSALRASAVDVMPLEDAIARVSSGSDRRPAVAVTFDDGYVGVHEHGADILARYGIPATIFVTTDAIGTPRFDGVPERLGRPLTWPELDELRRRTRCTIGSHTATHPILARLDAAGIATELRRSRETIADRLGSAPTAFAYPFGSYGSFDERTRRATIDAGFRVACTTVWGAFRTGADPLTVPRARVSWVDNAREMAKTIAGCYEWFRIVQRWQQT